MSTCQVVRAQRCDTRSPSAQGVRESIVKRSLRWEWRGEEESVGRAGGWATG